MRVDLSVIYALLVVALGHCAAHAAKGLAPVEQEQPAIRLDDELSKSISSFFDALTRKDVAGAYEQLTRGTVIAEKAEEMSQLKSKTRQAIELFGDLQGSENVEIRYVGTRLSCVTSVSIGKRFPLRWRFYFYRADEQWKLIDIRVDDRLVEMFEQPVKP